MLSKGLKQMENRYLGDGNFFHKCILRTLIMNSDRTRITYFTSFTYFHNGWYKTETEYHCWQTGGLTEKLSPSSGKQYLNSPEKMNGMKMCVPKCNFLISLQSLLSFAVLFGQILQHWERMTILWKGYYYIRFSVW